MITEYRQLGLWTLCSLKSHTLRDTCWPNICESLGSKTFIDSLLVSRYRHLPGVRESWGAVEKEEQGWVNEFSSCLSTKKSLWCLRDKIVLLPWICVCMCSCVCMCKPSLTSVLTRGPFFKTTFIIFQPEEHIMHCTSVVVSVHSLNKTLHDLL